MMGRRIRHLTKAAAGVLLVAGAHAPAQAQDRPVYEGRLDSFRGKTTEQKIQEAMDRLARGRTVFAIAHRLSTLRRASRLFVIEDGRLTEQGTHPELIQKQTGTYRRLYQLQQQLQDAG